MKTSSSSIVLRVLALAALLFSSCKAVTGTGQPPAALAPTATQAETPTTTAPDGSLAPTQALPPTATVEAGLPTRGPTVTAIALPTRTPGPEQAITLAPGLEPFTHPEIPDFVFPADPNIWDLAPRGENPYAFLRNMRVARCTISAVPGRGIGTPERVLRWQLGRLRWHVLDYGSAALAGIEQPAQLYLELSGFANPDCRDAQQALMEQVMLKDELAGKAAFALLPTPTLRPPLEGFACPNTPPARLRVGDTAHIVTNDLWLRSAPRPGDDTEIRTYDSTAPVYIEVIDGPVCTEKFVYWQVRIGLIGEGAPDPEIGWLAEGDLNEYFLAPGF